MGASDIIQIVIGVIAAVGLVVAILAKCDSGKANKLAEKALEHSEEANAIAKQSAEADREMAEQARRQGDLTEAEVLANRRRNRATVIAVQESMGRSEGRATVTWGIKLRNTGRVDVTNLSAELRSLDWNVEPRIIARDGAIRPGDGMSMTIDIPKEQLWTKEALRFDLVLGYEDGHSERHTSQRLVARVSPTDRHAATFEYAPNPTDID